MEYNISQNVTREDYIAFVVHHMKASMLRPFNIILFSISIGYLAISPFFAEPRNFTFTFIGLGLIIVLFGMSMLVKRNAGRQYDKMTQGLVMTYQFTNDSLTYGVNGETRTLKWFDLYMAHETEDYLYIYLNKNNGMMVIKRELPEDGLTFVKSKLKEYIKPRRLKISA